MPIVLNGVTLPTNKNSLVLNGESVDNVNRVVLNRNTVWEKAAATISVIESVVTDSYENSGSGAFSYGTAYSVRFIVNNAPGVSITAINPVSVSTFGNTPSYASNAGFFIKSGLFYYGFREAIYPDPRYAGYSLDCLQSGTLLISLSNGQLISTGSLLWQTDSYSDID